MNSIERKRLLERKFVYKLHKQLTYILITRLSISKQVLDCKNKNTSQSDKQVNMNGNAGHF